MSHLTVERSGHVVTCRISNPPSHTLGFEALSELLELVGSIGAEARVVVFTGGGDDVFIAHFEIDELAEASEAGGNLSPSNSGQDELHDFNKLCLAIEQAPWVSVAAMNGRAAGAGIELALACDFRVTSDGPWWFGLPETNVGIIPGGGGTQRLARLLGTAKALDLILHAEMYRPDQALEMGVVHRVFPEADFTRSVEAFASNLASRSPIALRAARTAIREGASLPIEDALRIEQREMERAMSTNDAAGAMRAWLKGETWEWTGR